jgi:hypothetical protein
LRFIPPSSMFSPESSKASKLDVLQSDRNAGKGADYVVSHQEPWELGNQGFNSSSV